jgi:hypothetical protein
MPVLAHSRLRTQRFQRLPFGTDLFLLDFTSRLTVDVATPIAEADGREALAFLEPALDADAVVYVHVLSLLLGHDSPLPAPGKQVKSRQSEEELHR